MSARTFWYKNMERFGSTMDTGTLDFADAYVASLKSDVPVAPAPTAGARELATSVVNGIAELALRVPSERDHGVATTYTFENLLAVEAIEGAMEAYASSRSEKDAAEIERLSKQIDELVNEGGLNAKGLAALGVKPRNGDQDYYNARAEAAESKLSQLVAACEKFLKYATGKSPEEIVAILNGGQQ